MEESENQLLQEMLRKSNNNLLEHQDLQVFQTIQRLVVIQTCLEVIQKFRGLCNYEVLLKVAGKQ